MPAAIPVLVCVDVEPDSRLVPVGDPAPWKGFEKTYEFFARLRPWLAAVTGSRVHFCWFFRMDPQVERVYGSPTWPMTHYARQVEDLQRHGDEIGLHTHAYRWDEGGRGWISDHGNPDWVDQCVRVSFQAFGEVQRRSCDSFRFGDRWMSDRTLDLLERLGVRFELTLEPGHAGGWNGGANEPVTGVIPDYSGVSRTPYRPSRVDFRVPDPFRTDGMWMIPLSTGTVAGIRPALERVARRALGRPGSDGMLTLHLWHSPTTVWAIADRLVRELEPPYLAFAVRSEIPGFRRAMRRMQRIFARVARQPRSGQFVFSTPAEALGLLGLAPAPTPAR